MKIGSVLIFVFTLMSFGITAAEQPRTGFDPDLPISNLVLDRWTYKDGLASNNVNAIYQDSQHFIWIASYNGIMRFDGVDFVHFGPENVEVIRSNSIYNIYEDTDSTLWFSSEASGIVGYKNGKFFTHPANPTIPRSVNCMIRSSTGEYWIGSNNAGLYKYIPNKKSLKIGHIPDVTVLALLEDDNGSLWIATQGNGLFRISSGEVSHFTRDDGLPANVVLTLSKDKDGNLLAGTPLGLCVVANDSIRNYEPLGHRQVDQTLIDDYGTLWAATFQGLARSNEDKGIFEAFSNERNYLGRRVTSLCFDREGSLWIGTYKSGLLRLKPGKITNITRENGLSFNHVNIVNSRRDQIYIGSEDGVLNIFDPNQGKVTKQFVLHDVGLRDVLPDRHGNVWIGSYEGLFKIPFGSGKPIDLTHKITSNEVRTIFEAKDGDIWVGTRSGGLIRLDGNLQAKVYDKDHGLTSNYILSVQQDDAENLIVGTHSGGLLIFDKAGNWTQHAVTSDDSGLLIFSARPDSASSIWLATNFGLYYYSENTVVPITLDKGLGHEKFFDVIADGQGGLWLTSDAGIVYIKLSEVQAFQNGLIPSVPYVLYNESDGMTNRECSGATRSYIDKNTGKIWVPTLGGVAIVDPSIELSNEEVPNVVITGATVDGASLDLFQSDIEAEPGSFRYTFTFTSLSFMVPDRVKFKYRLEGIDDEWKVIKGDRKIEYTNLPYGSYQLRVLGSNGQGVWNEQGASLYFEVLPFFYETRWFLFLMIASLTCALWLLYRWRVSEIKEKNVALTKINSELDSFVYRASHDLRTPVTSTLSLVNIALGESSTKDKDEYIKLIDQCAQKLDHIILDIIEYSKNKNKELEYDKFSIRELIDDVLNDIRYVDDINGIEINMTVDKDVLYSDRSRIKIILSNFIANAVHYIDVEKSKPFVKIQVAQTKEKTTISVEDNGIGIPSGEASKIFNMFYRGNHKSKGSGLGLYIVNETAKKLNGVVSVASELGKGSKFALTIPNG